MSFKIFEHENFLRLYFLLHYRAMQRRFCTSLLRLRTDGTPLDDMLRANNLNTVLSRLFKAPY